MFSKIRKLFALESEIKDLEYRRSYLEEMCKSLEDNFDARFRRLSEFVDFFDALNSENNLPEWSDDDKRELSNYLQGSDSGRLLIVKILNAIDFYQKQAVYSADPFQCNIAMGYANAMRHIFEMAGIPISVISKRNGGLPDSVNEPSVSSGAIPVNDGEMEYTWKR